MTVLPKWFVDGWMFQNIVFDMGPQKSMTPTPCMCVYGGGGGGGGVVVVWLCGVFC